MACGIGMTKHTGSWDTPRDASTSGRMLSGVRRSALPEFITSYTVAATVICSPINIADATRNDVG